MASAPTEDGEAAGGAMPFVANGIAPPLPSSEHIGLPRPNTIFQFFIFHFSFFTIILPPSGREGDREAVEGARGHEGNGLPCMGYSPLFF